MTEPRVDPTVATTVASAKSTELLSKPERRRWVLRVAGVALVAGLIGLGVLGGYRWGARRAATVKKPPRIGYVAPDAAGAGRTPGFDYVAWTRAHAQQPLHELGALDASRLGAWQRSQRSAFKARFYFPYEGTPEFNQTAVHRDAGTQTETWHVSLGGALLFRFFKLPPRGTKLGTLLVFMGHGKVAQLLTDAGSYQAAAGAALARAGYEVYVMENVGMTPTDAADAHLHLDSLLSLNGYGWYSLLLAHQELLVRHVLEHRVSGERLGAAGVSTGGFLALTAAALHPEVDAASVHGIFASAADSFGRDFTKHCECGSIDGLLPEFDLPSLALMIAPRPLHVNNNQSDSFSPDDARAALELIEPLRLRLGGPTPVFTSPPGKHGFAVAQTLEFFSSVWRNDR